MQIPVLSSQAHIDLSTEELVRVALLRKEAVQAKNGALTAKTGDRTGRSPKDRYIVRDQTTENTVDWGVVNQAISIDSMNALWSKAENYLKDKEIFVSNLSVGEDDQYGIPVQVITEFAWHAIFVKHLFIRTPRNLNPEKQWTMLNAPGLNTDPTVDSTNSDATLILDFTNRRILLIGLKYAGEMKKAMFTVLNYFLPENDVLPMHCAANMGEDKSVALFFGLSGTGKTTLSSDPDRYLIGDDEHGWSKTSVFNFEGGCYAKCIDLSQDREPIIWDAIRDGAIMENVVVDPLTLIPDYGDARHTQNTRAAYPREFIEKRVLENKGGIPKSVLFLTCDLYGVLPPVSLLTKEQAAYYFLSGYTALVGSTEMGSGAGIKPTFSTCFGAPFFPRPAKVYADLLIKRIVESGAQVYLINTGWSKGAYGQGGQRFSIPVTRAIVTAAISGELINAESKTLPNFNFQVPLHVKGVDEQLLDPSKGWANLESYRNHRQQLIQKFIDNFSRFDVPSEILDAGPKN
jgi:phosphoenolpyruvate carboxykinase (ATP)